MEVVSESDLDVNGKYIDQIYTIAISFVIRHLGDKIYILLCVCKNNLKNIRRVGIYC